MKRMLWALPIVAAAAAAVVWATGRDRRVADAPPAVAFVAPGRMTIELAGPAEVIEVRNAAGRRLAHVPTFGQGRVNVYLPWRPGQRFEVLADGGPPRQVVAPTAAPQYAIRLHAPIGQTPQEVLCDGRAATPVDRVVHLPVDPGETIDLMLELEQTADAPSQRFAIDVAAPDEHRLAVESSPHGQQAQLAMQFDKRFFTSRLTVGSELPERPLVFRVHGPSCDATFEVRLVRRNVRADRLTVVDWHLPTAPDGSFEQGHVDDRINLPSALWTDLAGWFGVRAAKPAYFEPFVHQTLVLRNDGVQPISLLLRASVIDRLTGQQAEFFRSPLIESAGGTHRVTAHAHLEPGQTRRCVLPVYLHPSTPPGNFTRRVELTPMGSDRPIKVCEAPLGVVRARTAFSLWTIAAAALSGTWLLLVVVFYRRLTHSLGVRVLILLALLGSLQFGLQLAGGLVSIVLQAVLGPLNCLVGGLLTEVLSYLLVASILYLTPRVGAMTIAGLIAYLVGGVLFGSFGLNDLLFVGTAIALRELLLAALGVTRIDPPPEYRPNLLAMMIALGLADAGAKFTSLALQAVFFRLFFADWYIALVVVVTGFGYTALGVYLGHGLGISLRKVEP